MEIEALVMGGGPGGTTVATLLARNGIKTTLVEKMSFPRFHIGESLLPASTPIFEKLGVLDEIKRTYNFKAGGIWRYGNYPLASNFAECRPSATFSKDPSAFFVERKEFDSLLLNNAKKNGVDVRIPCEATNIVFDTNLKITSVDLIDEHSAVTTVSPKFIFDCTGYSSIISHQLDIRDHNHLKRMAIFSQFTGDYTNKDFKNWFVGQMYYDSWIWLIPLSANHISIGLVTSVKRYEEAKANPEEFYNREVIQSQFLKDNFSSLTQTDEVHLYGNLGYSSKKVFGPNWALVGDTAFFIDPCFSSGVHLALKSGMGAAETYIAHRNKPERSLKKAFTRYQKELRHHELIVSRFVDAFYFASRSALLRKIIPKIYRGFIRTDFVHISGGDYHYKPYSVHIGYYLHKILQFLFPDPKPDWDK